MSAARSTPTTRQRELAERLRALRTERGMTVEAAAEQLMVSPSKISRLETAARRASPRDVRDLCLLYRVSDDERTHLMALAAQALETTWYQDADIDAVFQTFVGLEQAATDIDTLQSNMLPGLLQTADYGRALIAGLRVPSQMPAVRLEGVLEVRARRQELLQGPNPPRLHAIVDELALRRPVGSPAVMLRQMEVLLDATTLPHVELQVIPLETGSHPGLDGRFTILRFSDGHVRDTVYVEGLLGELFLDKDYDVARYLETFRHLAENVAHDAVASRRVLDEVRSSWR